MPRFISTKPDTCSFRNFSGHVAARIVNKACSVQPRSL